MKPLGRKNYGSIGHLPCSRMGPADHACHPGQQRIATERARDRHDIIIITEKVDGSNVGVARVDDTIHAVGRAGWPAQTSKYEQHQLFAAWVREHEPFWRDVLQPGQRLVGEWMAQAHGTRYALPSGPFAAFDLMTGEQRAPFADLSNLCVQFSIPMPKLIHMGSPLPVAVAMQLHGAGNHGLLEEPEGVVYRIERQGAFDFMAKWVRPDKVDGKYLPEISGGEPVWNWRPPKQEAA